MSRLALLVVLAIGCTQDRERAPAPPPPTPAPVPAPVKPPEHHKLRYQMSAMAGSWHGKTVPGLGVKADLDLDAARIATHDPSGDRTGELTAAQTRELRELAAAACATSRQPPSYGCTDASFELWIEDGACHTLVHDTCPLAEPTAARLVAAMFRAADWK